MYGKLTWISSPMLFSAHGNPENSTSHFCFISQSFLFGYVNFSLCSRIPQNNSLSHITSHFSFFALQNGSHPFPKMQNPLYHREYPFSITNLKSNPIIPLLHVTLSHPIFFSIINQQVVESHTPMCSLYQLLKRCPENSKRWLKNMQHNGPKEIHAQDPKLRVYKLLLLTINLKL